MLPESRFYMSAERCFGSGAVDEQRRLYSLAGEKASLRKAPKVLWVRDHWRLNVEKLHLFLLNYAVAVFFLDGTTLV
jgi:hypothetical protein